ncbi:MAG TPA: hypothetical protein DCY12_11810 [Candidatus Atribacteria bacterium]|nr:hypothetical protein [Candidatus Atribacteria bacterium]
MIKFVINKAGIKKTVKTDIKSSQLVKSKRLQIAIGASRLFIKKGYFQTSIREISKETGITIGNLYDYISGKEDILYLVFDVFHSMWLDKLTEEGIFKMEEPVKQLEVAIRKMLELVNSHREMIFLMYTETKLLQKDYLEIILEKEARLVKYFEDILRRGIEKKVFKIKDPFFMANVIVYMLSLEPLRGWNLRKSYKVEQINRLNGNFILDNILKR